MQAARGNSAWFKRGANVCLVLVGLLALGGGVTLALRHGSPSAPAERKSAAALFEHTFSDADGQPQALTQWRGRWLLVNFWATWCAPCVEEMPDLQRVHSEYSGRDLAVIGLAIDNPGAVKRFRDSLKLELPLLIAGAAGTELARELGNTSGALPYTVLIDRSGFIARSKLGQLREAELRAWLRTHLDASADAVSGQSVK